MATASHQDVKHAFPIANQTTHAMAGSCCAGNLKKMDAGIYCVENAVAALSVAAFDAMLGMGHMKLNMQVHKFRIEKAFLNGQASGELIVPFQYSMASDITVQPFTRTVMANTEFRLLAFGGKYLLHICQTQPCQLVCGSKH